MNIDERISQLCERLMNLGYYRFQVRRMMQTVIGNSDMNNASDDQQLRIVDVLENYEKLANDYFFAYSK